jgi:Uma2 family endonuclease
MGMTFDLAGLTLPARLRLSQPMTDDELEIFCERQEIVHVEREPNGDLELRPIGGTLSGYISTQVTGQLHRWNEADGAGVVLPNVGCFLPDGSMRGARISWLSKATWDAIPTEGFLPVCPAFVVKIVSLNYTLEEMRDRIIMWIVNGAELAWLFDVARKAVEVYRPGHEPEVLEGGSALEGEGPVAGFVLELGRIWG